MAEILAEVDAALAQLDTLVLGSARGGKRVAPPVEVEVVRALTQDDVPLLLAPPPVGSTAPSVQKMRHQHHLLARTLAEGHSHAAAALITGFSVSRISILSSDPTFQHLLQHYTDNKDLIFTDLMERMKTLGLSTLEELQARLDEKPDEWSKRELMDLAELLLVKGKGPGAGAASAAGSPAVAISVSFVQAAVKPDAIGGGSAPIIEGKIDG